jgi:hypothetical protein
MLVEMPRQQPGNDFEIFVMMRGQPASVFLRFGGRAAGWGRMTCEVDFAGEQHQESRLLALFGMELGIEPRLKEAGGFIRRVSAGKAAARPPRSKVMA